MNLGILFLTISTLYIDIIDIMQYNFVRFLLHLSKLCYPESTL